VPVVERLTSEVAKRALLEMIRSKPHGPDGWFKPKIVDAIANMRVEQREDGWSAWSAFEFKPAEAVYRLVIVPPPDHKGCVFEYVGAFQIRDGRWVAAEPKLVGMALQSEK
jgi:hypothetical protein